MRHEVNLPYKAMRNRFARCRVVMVWMRISRIYETRELGVNSLLRVVVTLKGTQTNMAALVIVNMIHFSFRRLVMRSTPYK